MYTVSDETLKMQTLTTVEICRTVVLSDSVYALGLPTATLVFLHSGIWPSLH